jgi:polysaccharide chain length determinant protein (PEP-CTERM system associated)
MSQATLLVVPQQVPARYVTPTTETSVADALQGMTQDVLSRARLLELINEFDLYHKQRQRMAPEEVIALMRQYIDIAPVDPSPARKEINGFKISFIAEKAALAQEVTSKLTSFFISANVKMREDQATNTTNFLEEQLKTAEEALAVQEGRVRDFKTQYLGELPEQQQGNLAILNGAQAQLQNIAASLDRAQQNKAYTESLLNAYQRMMVRGTSVPGTTPGNEIPKPRSPLQIAQDDLARLKSERAKLLTNFKAPYPPILTNEREISADEALIRRLQTSISESTVASEPARGNSSATKDAVEDDAATAQLKSQLESNHLEIENLTREETKQKALIDQYQKRLNNTPIREEQLAGIQRDYELSKKDYEDLLSKKQQSQLAMSLEKQQGGQQFRLVEPPSLPERPTSPDRMKLGLAGFGGGLFLGLAVAFLKDLARPTFHTTKEITLKLGAPLVIGVPVLLSRAERKRQGLIRVFEVVGVSVIVSAICLAEFYIFRHP